MTTKAKPFCIHNVQGAFETKAIIPIRTETNGGGGGKETAHQHYTEK